jgi:hypothetical protein
MILTALLPTTSRTNDNGIRKLTAEISGTKEKMLRAHGSALRSTINLTINAASTPLVTTRSCHFPYTTRYARLD